MAKSNGNGRSLKLDPHNARKHPDRNKAQIAASLRELGAGRSILVDATDTVIAGNGVYEQAQALGYRVKVVETDGKTLIAVKRPDLKGAKARRMALADNRATETSEWDVDVLADLAAHDADALAGLFEERELRELLGDKMPGGKAEAADAGELVDKAAELQAKWQVQRGDVWQVGKHRLMCGDSTNAADVATLMQRERANASVTDPPYGVGVEYGSFVDTPENVRALVAKVMPFILDNTPAALTPGVPAMWDYPRPSWVGAWVHPASTSSGAWGFVGANPILYYGKDPYLKSGKGRRDSSIVLASDRKGENEHPVSKPLNVWTWLIERMTPERGQIVLDLFNGSGTTLVACEQTGRIGRGMEIEPKYVSVSLERLTALGLEAKRVNDGNGKAKRKAKAA